MIKDIYKTKSILIVILFLILAFPCSALAASVNLRWDPNTESDISSYNVYYGTTSRGYGNPIPVGNVTSHVIDGLQEGTTYFFSVTAVDTSGNESGYSSEISANATSSTPASEPYQIVLSTNSDRTSAVPLNNQTVSGDAFIFIQPENAISEVSFYVDGKFSHTERYAPYDFGQPTQSITNIANGRHTISAKITLQDNSVQNVSAACRFISQPTSVTVSSNVSSPQVSGTNVVLTASASGGSGTYEYRFWVNGPSTGNTWQMVRDWSSDDNFTWTVPSATGTYSLGVWVKNSGDDDTRIAYKSLDGFVVQTNSPAVNPIPSDVLLSASKNGPLTPGESLVLSASGIGSSGNYEYRFWVLGPATGNTWQMVRDWSSDDNFTWTASSATGTYSLGVWVKNSGDDDTRIAYKALDGFTVTP